MRPHPHVVDVEEGALFVRLPGERGFDCGMRDGRVRVGALQLARLQRLDMALDLDVGAELASESRFEPRGDLMRIAKRHAAVHLDIETDRRAAVEFLHGHVMDLHMAFRGDQGHALQDGFVVEGDRMRRDGDERPPDARALTSATTFDLDGGGLFERQRPRNRDSRRRRSLPRRRGAAAAVVTSITPGTARTIAATSSTRPFGAASVSVSTVRRPIR